MYFTTLNAKISQKYHKNFTKISQTRIRIQKDLRAGSGSEMTLQVGSGSGSEINSFGSATLMIGIGTLEYIF